MNLPNKLTIFRILLVPVFVLTYYLDFKNSHFVATAVFIIASITDWLDGHIARRRNLITNFGKFMDPLADKILVISAFIMLVEKSMVYAWVVIIVISREFIVSGLRLIAASNNVVLAAGKMGKSKTVTQMIAVILLLMNNFPFDKIGIRADLIFLYISTFLTIISGIDYVYKNRDILDFSNE